MKNAKLTRETVARYRRAATLPPAIEQIAALNRCSWHHELLDAVGKTNLAVGVIRRATLTPL